MQHKVKCNYSLTKFNKCKGCCAVGERSQMRKTFLWTKLAAPFPPFLHHTPLPRFSSCLPIQILIFYTVLNNPIHDSLRSLKLVSKFFLFWWPNGDTWTRLQVLPLKFCLSLCLLSPSLPISCMKLGGPFQAQTYGSPVGALSCALPPNRCCWLDAIYPCDGNLASLC